jgi:hypothetical protein
MTGKWRTVIRFFISIIRWDEVLIGVMMLFLGQAFNKFYGFRFDASIFLNLVIWFFFIKASTRFIKVIFSDGVDKSLPIDFTSTTPSGNLRLIFTQVIWIFSILTAVMSFIPLMRIRDSTGFNHLSIWIFSFYYFANFIFFLEPVQHVMEGMHEFIYAFANAFLLPALSFSIQQDFLKPALILTAFPVFLQLIVLKVGENMESCLEGKRLPADSLIARLGSPGTLRMTAILAMISGLTLFLETEISGIWYKTFIFTLESVTAGLYFRSIVKQTPNWKYAYQLTRLLSIAMPVLIIAAVWPF